MAVESDNREIPRKPLRSRLRIATPDHGTIEGRATDVSTAGIGFIAGANLRPGTVCTLVFALPFKDGTSYQASVSVLVSYCLFSAHADGFRAGGVFQKPSKALQDAVQRYFMG
jgi:hypothetical protein